MMMSDTTGPGSDGMTIETTDLEATDVVNEELTSLGVEGHTDSQDGGSMEKKNEQSHDDHHSGNVDDLDTNTRREERAEKKRHTMGCTPLLADKEQAINEKGEARQPVASRQTVEELEAYEKAKEMSASETVSRPGAFSVGGNDTSMSGRTGNDQVVDSKLSALGGERDGRQGVEESKEEETLESLPQNGLVQLPSLAEESNPAPHATWEMDSQNANQTSEPDVPMVVAELCLPPIHAVQVIYDEHAEANMDPEDATSAVVQYRNQTTTNSQFQPFISHRHQRTLSLFLCVLCVLSILLAVVVPISMNTMSKGNNDKAETLSPAPITESTPPTDPPSYPYECFRSTRDLISAQYRSPDQDLFRMCPNTRIKLGVLSNPMAGDISLINGDSPLTVLRPNVEVRCGLNGSVHDNCVLDGGFVQVLLQPKIWLKQLLPIEMEQELEMMNSTPTHDVTIRGMTFTGQLMSTYNFGGASVAISNPGHKVRMINCLWENMTAPSGLVYVGVNPYQIFSSLKGYAELEPNAASLIVVNSTFRNITYDGSLVVAMQQGVSLKSCLFEDLSLSPFASASVCQSLLVDGNDTYIAYCIGVFSCEYDSICSMQDICVRNVEYAGPAPLMIATNYSQISLTGTIFMDRLRVPSNMGGVTEACPTGMAMIEPADYFSNVECIDEVDTLIQGGWAMAEVCSVPTI